MSSTVFNIASARHPQKQRRAKDFYTDHEALLVDEKDAYSFLDYIFTPADKSWAYLPSGKTGTSSTLAFLFHLTTGHPLTAHLQQLNGMNPDQAAHELHRTMVFCSLLARGDKIRPARYLQRTLKLATVRDPMARAISGFRYLCQADARGMTQFYTDRARMSALTGFDWNRHPDTPEGFERFLDYLRIDLVHHADRPVDSHFRPQVLNIRPALFVPDLIGRCEDLGAFFTAIADRLGRALPEGALEAPARNRGTGPERADLVSQQARQLVAEIFAADYEAFGYDL
ncbi:sulfotransferase family 2 domain-containing protein [Pseudooceanicola nanhaiensis]|uniref:sulfotransferase family 2 domain-containing protein n=1 Tax=Pseudooceanicola nanhaiensis TaxID=375761 RepID=UPI001CD1DB0E|nr:sulfotransferase family 2 domain-containing protein [Pseudooceanicola nanhaiensis]MCA0922772.1 sulfotransferase family protein [Pseudooceanicola nanhaiensis]